MFLDTRTHSRRCRGTNGLLRLRVFAANVNELEVAASIVDEEGVVWTCGAVVLVVHDMALDTNAECKKQEIGGSKC